MELRANTIHYGFIFDENEKIDEVLALIMKAPHTYTAEDTVEIDCHGGPFVMQKILSCTLRAGARLAEPGEFTRRAFMNGRIDLSAVLSGARYPIYVRKSYRKSLISRQRSMIRSIWIFPGIRSSLQTV